MLSRLKRRAASSASPGGDSSSSNTGASTSSPSSLSVLRHSSEPPDFDPAPSPPSSRPVSPERTRKPNRHSFATPIKTGYDAAAPSSDEVGRTLSPNRIYASGGRTSRSSSISSYTGAPGASSRRSLALPSPTSSAVTAGGEGMIRFDDQIGHGSLSLDQVSPGTSGSTAPMTLVVHAPELLRPDDDGQEWLDDDAATPVMPPGSEQRTPLAPPRSLSVPMAQTLATAGGSGHVEHRHRALTTGDVRFVPPPMTNNGLDALAAINLPSGSSDAKRANLNASLDAAVRDQTRSASLSPEASRSNSRSVSRRNSFQNEEAAVRRGRSATTSSPSRGWSKSMAKNGTANALAFSGVAIASPNQTLRVPSSSAAGPISPVATEFGERKLYPTLHEPPYEPAAPGEGASAPAMSARNSLESHMSPALGATDTEEYLEYRSTYGDHASAFLSMDQLGDFDDVVSQLGTGYAVASSKRNAEFHALFKHIPDDDYLIEDYGCALQREILIQGRLYISEHHLSFNANIFGWVTSLTIPFSEVVSIEKRMTAYVIPNAIQITTLHARHIFASFLSRDTTYDLIGNIWRMVHPVVPMSAALPDSMSTHAHVDSDEDGADDDNSPDGVVVHASGVESGQASERRVRDRAKRKLKGLSGRKRGGTDATDKSTGSAISTGAAGAPTVVDAKRKDRESSATSILQPHAQTVDTCPTLKNLKEVCMDTTFPGKPEKIYNLMFTSGFMKNFWAENQKLTEIQIGDWAPQSSGSNLLARSMSYIKPLNGSIGPRQTKCLITDESAHVDFDDFVCVITTTRTPDVPSGSAFAVKTRTSMTWGAGNKCRVVVTTGVEWSKSSFIKGIIEKSAIEGQKQYHTDLEKAMRSYISTHRNEFVEEGQDPDAAAACEAAEQEDKRTEPGVPEDGASAMTPSKPATASPVGLLGPIWSTVEPVLQALSQQSPTSLALGAIVAILLLSNLWTLRGRDDGHSLHPAERARRRALARQGLAEAGESAAGPEEDVAKAVRDVLNNYFAAAQAGVTPTPSGPIDGVPRTYTAQPVNAELAADRLMGGDAELEELAALLDRVEQRAQRLRAELEQRRTAAAT